MNRRNDKLLSVELSEVYLVFDSPGGSRAARIIMPSDIHPWSFGVNTTASIEVMDTVVMPWVIYRRI